MGPTSDGHLSIPRKQSLPLPSITECGPGREGFCATTDPTSTQEVSPGTQLQSFLPALAHSPCSDLGGDAGWISTLLPAPGPRKVVIKLRTGSALEHQT